MAEVVAEEAGKSPDVGALRFCILGPLQVLRDGQPVGLGGRQQRAVLALLVLDANQVLPLDRVVDRVWPGGPPDGAATTVQTYVHHLRQALEPDRARGAAARVLVTEGGGYALRVDRAQVDALLFQDRVRAGRAALARGEYEDAAEEVGEALQAWRGSALADLADYEFARAEADRLEELRLAGLEIRIAADLALGRHQLLTGELERLVSQHPLRETFHAQLILAYYRCGRQADALAAFQRVRELLADELGVDPGEPLQRLHAAVLAHDPSLDAPLPTAVAPPVRAATGRPTGAPVPTPPRSKRRRRLGLLAAGTVLAVVGAGVVVLASRAGGRAPELPGNSVGAIDARGRQVGDPVPVQQSPAGLAYGAGAVWAVNTGSNSLSRIDPRTRAVVQTIQVGVAPTGVAVSGDDVWVVNSGDGTVSRVNAVTNTVVGPAIRVGNQPAAVAVGPSGLWVTDSADDTIVRIDPATGAVGDPIAVGGGPDGIAVADDVVWVADGRDGTITRVDPVTRGVSGPIFVGAGPEGIAVTPTAIWVTNALEQSVWRLDPDTGRLVQAIPVGDGPRAIVAGRDAVWVSSEYDGTLTRINPRTNKAMQRIRVGGSPRGLAMVGSQVWVAARAFTARSHRGGTLTVVAHLPGQYSIDPSVAYEQDTWEALYLVYDRLVVLRRSEGADGLTLAPDLATGMPRPADGGRSYTFTVRRGIHYSNRALVTPGDFRRGVERQFTIPGARPDYYAGIVGAQACLGQPKPPTTCDLSRGIVTDDRASAVTFHLTAPDPDFLYKLSTFAVPVPPGTPTTEAQTPVPGTGPYMIASRVPLTLVRNRHFRQWSYPAQPAGYPDTIRWLSFADADQEAAAVISGQADVNKQLTPSAKDELGVRYPAQLRTGPLASLQYEFLNTQLPPFDDVRVRRAVNYAVDRATLVHDWGGARSALLTCQALPANFPGHQLYCPYTVGPGPDQRWRGPDLTTAQRLVDASGTRGMPVRVWSPLGEPQHSLTVHVADALRRLGYRVTRHEISWDQYYSAVEDPRNRAQIGWLGWAADYPSPTTFFDQFACGGVNNVGPYCNRSLEALVSQAEAAVPTDPATARRLWAQADRLLTDDAPFIAVANDVSATFVSARIGNFKANPIIGPLLDQMWVQ